MNNVFRYAGMTALVLWIVTIGVLGFMFVKGKTVKSDDGRTGIVLQENERDFVLTEMRDLLASINGIITSLAKDDYPAAAQWARKVGLKGHNTIEAKNPTIMAKLPIGFKQMGMSLHKDFDEVADMIDKKMSQKEIMGRMGETTSKCISCHSTFKLVTDDK